MTDGVSINPSSVSGGPEIRTIDKTATGMQTQMVLVDVGGGTDASPETALTTGQKTMANSLPATIASDQPPINVTTTNGALEIGGNLALVAAAQGAGGTGIAEPTGGTGILGWLSGIYSKLSGALAVTGTFWQATQPVSAASLPLPAGAATAALQPALNADGGSLAHITNLPATQPVSGTFWQATQPVSAAALPLPANAAQETGGNLAAIATSVAGTLTQQPAAHAATASSGTGTTSASASTSTQILAANASRRKIIFANNGTATIVLNYLGAASATAGFAVAAGGTYFDDNPCNAALQAFSTVASVPYTLLEC